ncbi:hypothetical protein Pint_34084 [Pistacia integerrima]|uniref:Uncharacterized protein n=1 Tax=Pistacia integerrima TaxID=434235 RepID=A0ACC0X945_9ROSI|nr:hypothetical protein Pint_34084 [Pistacia integerrima]
MATCSYGLAQFMMQKLPQYPLPTHEVPTEFEDEKKYETIARTKFQKCIKLKQNYVVNFSTPQNAPCRGLLYDHQSLKLNEDDFERVYRIPKKKGANFRDLLGVLVSLDKKDSEDKRAKDKVERVETSASEPWLGWGIEEVLSAKVQEDFRKSTNYKDASASRGKKNVDTTSAGGKKGYK